MERLYQLIKPVLFLLDPEKAHKLTLHLFHIGLKFPFIRSMINRSLEVTQKNNSAPFQLLGIQFPNKIGLAAGFDKNAEHINLMEKLGFGFIEIGTITPKAQEGNEKPRLFRLVKDESIINRMGFNNGGIETAIKNLKNLNTNIVIGGNIGKNKVTPNEQAFEDYEKCFTALFPYVDYFVINVSSPNTPDLRSLQDKGPLTNIINKLYQINKTKKYPKPILLKIAPDLNEDQINDIIDVVNETDIEGIIATNTTISRDNLKTDKKTIEKIGNGGLSGKILEEKANDMIILLRSKLRDNFPIIGVGGIHDAESAIKRINSGADLIQIYSALIYEGPFLVKRIKAKIEQL